MKLFFASILIFCIAKTNAQFYDRTYDQCFYPLTTTYIQIDADVDGLDDFYFNNYTVSALHPNAYVGVFTANLSKAKIFQQGNIVSPSDAGVTWTSTPVGMLNSKDIDPQYFVSIENCDLFPTAGTFFQDVAYIPIRIGSRYGFVYFTKCDLGGSSTYRVVGSRLHNSNNVDVYIPFSVGIEENQKPEYTINNNENNLCIKNSEALTFQLYNIDGKKMGNENTSDEFCIEKKFNTGIYLLQIKNIKGEIIGLEKIYF